MNREAAFGHPCPERTSLRRVTRLTVLIAADGADQIGAALDAAGHDVRVLYNGRDALVSALVDPPDVAILDTDLPRIDGWMVARRIRHGLGARRCLLVAVSASDGADGHLTRDAGFALGLTKPVDPAALVRLLGRHHPNERSEP